MADKNHLEKFLKENSVEKFYIEYNGFLSNHLAHGAIALFHLNDAKSHFDAYLTHYVKEKLEDSRNGDAAKSQKADDEIKGDVLGQRVSYYGLYNRYWDLYKNKYDSDLTSLVNGEFPELSRGLIGSLLHPMIHIGYGLSVESAQVVIEGLAYLNHSNTRLVYDVAKVPEVEALGKGDLDITEVLVSIASNDELFAFMESEMALKKGKVPMYRGALQSSLAPFVESRSEQLFNDYVHRIKVDFKDTDDLINWIVDKAIVVYLASEVDNDFALLHGVTSAWALKQILKRVHDQKHRLEAIRVFLAVFLMVYMAQGRPKLDLGKLKAKEGQKLPSWDEIKSAAFAKPVEEIDEHVFKLIQVCMDRDNANHMDMYKLASLTVVNMPFNMVRKSYVPT